MKKIIIFALASLVIVVSISFLFQSNFPKDHEYILTQKDEAELAYFLNQYPDAVEYISETYRLYYTNDFSLILGDRNDGMELWDKLNSEQ